MPLPNDPIQLSATPDVDRVFLTKATAFRGMLTALKAHGQYEAVYARVPPSVQKYMDAPPLGISWMPALVFQYVLLQLRAVASLDAVRVIGKDSVVQGPLKTMQPVVESMLRLFGAEPMAFYRRLPATLAGQLRGVEFEVVETGPRAVSITVTYSYLHNVPIECFVYWEGALAITWQICGVRGEAQTTVLDDSPMKNRGRIDIAWTK